MRRGFGKIVRLQGGEGPERVGIEPFKEEA